MIRVGVLGAAGRMGTTVARAVAATADLELVCAIDPASTGAVYGTIAGLHLPELVVEDGPEALVAHGVDVAIDFTVSASARENLAFCAANGIHAVCGTTGLSPALMEELVAAFSPEDAPNCVVAPNFAISAVLLIRLAEIAAPFFDSAEIVELHHDQKRDAPSGTALETARRIAGAKLAEGASPYGADPTEIVTLEGVRGGAGPSGIRVHSVRLRGLVAHQEVLFGTAGQSLTIRQDSYDRDSFMPGVLLAARRVVDTPGLTVGLDALLFGQ